MDGYLEANQTYELLWGPKPKKKKEGKSFSFFFFSILNFPSMLQRTYPSEFKIAQTVIKFR